MSALGNKFTNIVENGLWKTGGTETACGQGSTLRSVKRFNLIDELSGFIKTHKVKSIIDVGCGDFNWMRFVDLHDATYIGYDVVESLVGDNNEKYQSEHIKFLKCSGLEEDFEAADLLICKDVLFHQELSDVEEFLTQRLDKFKYLLLSHHPGVENVARSVDNSASFGFLNLNNFLDSKRIIWRKKTGPPERKPEHLIELAILEI